MAPPAVDDYDQDDVYGAYDDYEEDNFGEAETEELSPEDKASLEQGTSAVREALGADASKVSTKQIQDALWHYYYDIDKSVTYLKSTAVEPRPKSTPKKAIEGTLLNDVSSSILALSWDTGADFSHLASHGFGNSYPPIDQLATPASKMALGASVRMGFSDMPWLSLRPERMATFIAPFLPQGGLLGGGDGAPKMSKLQALAAARKKKNDSNKLEEPKPPEKSQTVAGALNELSLKDISAKGARKPNVKLPQHDTTTTKETLGSTSTDSASISEGLDDTSVQGKRDSKPPEALPRSGSENSSSTPEAEPSILTEKAPPSPFAQILLRSAPGGSNGEQRHVFAMPYTSQPSYSTLPFSKPSPDEIVLAAQAQAGKKTTPTSNKTPKKGSKEKTVPKEGDVSNGVSKLKISDIPPPKSKGLDVIKEFENNPGKRSASFVVVGHVDAGKSTLMGRLLVSLKYVDERTVEKFRKLAEKTGKQSFALAWIMDERSEERDRGVTIDIATNHFETESTKFTILDAPGHRDFVPNMIAGASQADFAIVVLDANTGAYEKGLKGQTREHVLLLRSLGVQRLVIAVNKLDMVAWSQERFDEICQQTEGFLTSIGFQSKFFSFIPISGLNGDNIAESIQDAAASWYTGPTLLDSLESGVPATERNLKKSFRMAISEVFRSLQGTTTLGGRIDSGSIQLGDVLFVQPSGETAYIKSIMVDKENQDWAVAGQNVTLALTDVDPIHIRAGDILCHTTDPIASGDSFTMKALAFEHLMPMPVDVHRGRLHAPGQLMSISGILDRSTGEMLKKKPKIVQPGAVARVSIKLRNKVPLEAGQRVVIRSGGETIAAGLVE